MTVATLRAHALPTAKVGIGLAVVGFAGYLFLALSGHRLPDSDAAAIASFYLIVSIAGPGMFSGLEQYTSRSTSDWLARGRDIGVIARQAAVVAAALLVVALAVLLLVGPLVADRVLAGRPELLWAVALAVVASAAVYLIRGLLGGIRRFDGYATTLVVEGVARIVLCVAFAFAPTPNAAWYALAFGMGTVIAVLAGLPWLRKVAGPAAASGPVERGRLREMAKGTALMVAASFGFHLVANLAPVVVTARLPWDTAVAAAFAAASVLVRIPVVASVAVQSVLLPTLTKAAAEGDLATVRATVAKFVGAVAVAGAGTVALAAAVGPAAVVVLFGGQVWLSSGLLALLGVATATLLLTQVLMPALVALGGHGVATAAWCAGAVVLIGVLALPTEATATAAWAQIAGCLTVCAVMVGDLARRLRAV